MSALGSCSYVQYVTLVLRRPLLVDPESRFFSRQLEYDPGKQPELGLRLYEDQSKSILSKNDSPDIAFSYSLNAYRGCAHGCAYCYARPSHEYLGFGSGADFERHIVYKPHAAELLRETFEKRSWQGEFVVISGNKILARILEMRDGRLNEPGFHARFRAQGRYAATLEATFRATCTRLGYQPFPEPRIVTFTRPAASSRQLNLFS